MAVGGLWIVDLSMVIGDGVDDVVGGRCDARCQYGTPYQIEFERVLHVMFCLWYTWHSRVQFSLSIACIRHYVLEIMPLKEEIKQLNNMGNEN